MPRMKAKKKGTKRTRAPNPAEQRPDVSADTDWQPAKKQKKTPHNRASHLDRAPTRCAAHRYRCHTKHANLPVPTHTRLAAV